MPDSLSPKPTAERILDAAEDLFAEHGYAATSLGDVADRVGIRTPSLYNHFRNKEALYLAVLERLLGIFEAPLETLRSEPLTRDSVLKWLETTVRLHHEHPNFARLVQHAALSGQPHTREPVNRLLGPMFDSPDRPGPTYGQLGEELRPWAVMALNNLVMSYITMAPVYRDLLGEDPLGQSAKDRQLEMVMTLAGLVIGDSGSDVS